ncbi:hypothetical protein QQP08_014179 [Theobroma cacao]|nr:hypothetical protein QQP08_014179 [Theobroma cacao]
MDDVVGLRRDKDQSKEESACRREGTSPNEKLIRKGNRIGPLTLMKGVESEGIRERTMPQKGVMENGGLSEKRSNGTLPKEINKDKRTVRKGKEKKGFLSSDRGNNYIIQEATGINRPRAVESKEMSGSEKLSDNGEWEKSKREEKEIKPKNKGKDEAVIRSSVEDKITMGELAKISKRRNKGKGKRKVKRNRRKVVKGSKKKERLMALEPKPITEDSGEIKGNGYELEANNRPWVTVEG